MLLEKKVTAIAYEMIQNDSGVLPVLKPMSQVGGRTVAQIGATLLQNNHGGKGVLVGGVPGVPPVYHTAGPLVKRHGPTLRDQRPLHVLLDEARARVDEPAEDGVVARDAEPVLRLLHS